MKRAEDPRGGRCKLRLTYAFPSKQASTVYTFITISLLVYSERYGVNVCLSFHAPLRPPNLYVEALILNIVAFGGGNFGE